MKLLLRAPLENEWKLCRMLLPETFSSVQAREYLLALDKETRRLLAAVSFRKDGTRRTEVRLHVLPRFRRMGVATEILVRLRADGVSSLSGVVDVRRETGALRLCEKLGFRRHEGLTTVEADVQIARSYLDPMCARGTFPANLRIVSLGEAPLAEVARLQSTYIARDSRLNPWRAQLADRPQLEASLIAILDGKVTGMMLWEPQEEVGIIRSRVAEAGPTSKWVNLLLLSRAGDLMWRKGLRRVQFGYADDNRDTRRLATRFKAEVVAEAAEYVWGVEN